MNEGNNISRRNFVRGGALIGAVAATSVIAGCSPRAAGASSEVVAGLEIVWEKEADIIVAGGGGGLLAACDAADTGNSVILLEKAGNVGGESSVNEAWLNGAGTSVQKAAGIDDSAELQAEDYMANHQAHAKNLDQSLLKDYCESSADYIERLIELGAEYHLDQDTLFYTTVPRAHMMQPDASAWGLTLGKAAEDRGVEILLNTPLTGLIADSSGQIIGVKSNDKSYKAKKAVILATGDVSGNERMKEKYQPEWAHIEAAIPSNTGDGLFAALSVGADSSFDQMIDVGPTLSWEPTGSVITFYQTLKGLIVVNKEGKRFANEDDNRTLAGVQYSQTDGEAFSIFDSRIAAMSMRPDCPISEINSKVFAGECVEIGLISGMGPAYLDDYLKDDRFAETFIKADSITEIAEKLDINEANLVAQIEAWNAAVAVRDDQEFGRNLTGALQFGDPVTISEPPFYALKMKRPKYICTEGPNLMINTDASVLDVEGKPISRLYACGAGLVAGTATLYANTCGDHMGITAYTARRAAARADELQPWE